MGLHPRVRMKKNLHWMERKRREKGKNINTNQNLVKGERRKTFPKTSAFTVMNSGIVP